MNQFKKGLAKYINEEKLEKIENTTVGIAGAGGLGSNCAQALVRLGFRKLIIIDYDRVESSNLNRQFYFSDQIGMIKVEALKENLLRINPDLELSIKTLFLDEKNIRESFSSCKIIVEAFDGIPSKKMLLETLSGSNKKVVSASGLGIEGDTDSIATRDISEYLTMIGDFKNCVSRGIAPMSPGVTVAAAKQAGAVLNHVLASNRAKEFSLPSIYGLTYSECSGGRSNIKIVEQMIKAGIKLIQYREKGKSQGEKFLECLEIRKMTQKAEVMFIVNDHIDIAMMVDADGVHIGQDDIPIRQVRKLIGSTKIIGISTHSPSQAKKAIEEGADYIGVGPIFATKTKKNVCDPVGYDYLEWVIKNIRIPFVAIGGIKKHNLHEIIRRGVECVSLVSEITENNNIPLLVGELKTIIKENKNGIYNTNGCGKERDNYRGDANSCSKREYETLSSAGKTCIGNNNNSM